MTDPTLKAMFAAWCARKGLTPVRRVHVLSAIGHAALRVRKGRYFTIEIATELDEHQVAVKEAGFKHGYDYPIVDTTRDQLVAFLEVSK